MSPDVMTPEHPRWEEFCAAMLELPADCDHHRNRSRTAAVLRNLDCDVPGSLAALAERGGCCCDCEVIMNVVLAEDT